MFKIGKNGGNFISLYTLFSELKSRRVETQFSTVQFWYKTYHVNVSRNTMEIAAKSKRIHVYLIHAKRVANASNKATLLGVFALLCVVERDARLKKPTPVCPIPA